MAMPPWSRRNRGSGRHFGLSVRLRCARCLLCRQSADRLRRVLPATTGPLADWLAPVLHGCPAAAARTVIQAGRRRGEADAAAANSRRSSRETDRRRRRTVSAPRRGKRGGGDCQRSRRRREPPAREPADADRRGRCLGGEPTLQPADGQARQMPRRRTSAPACRRTRGGGNCQRSSRQTDRLRQTRQAANRAPAGRATAEADAPVTSLHRCLLPHHTT